VENAVSSPLVRREVAIVPDAIALAHEGARRVRTSIAEAVGARSRCMLALSGGRTPRGLYEVLAQPPDASTDVVRWEGVHLFFGDERHVPPEHPDSNYRTVREALVSHVPIPTVQVHRLRTEQPDATGVAVDYAIELTRAFGLAPREWPTFDLVLLGMGSDGHTASLFPGTPVLEEREHLVAAVWISRLQSSRITLTYPVINNARHVYVLVSGIEKAETLRAVLEGPVDAERFPVQGVQPRHGQLTWLVDEPAASLLTRK
jgi:6-phosphogluconolactonase